MALCLTAVLVFAVGTGAREAQGSVQFHLESEIAIYFFSDDGADFVVPSMSDIVQRPVHFSTVEALEHPDSVEDESRPAAVMSFISNDGLYCAEGIPRAAESALALKKAAPAGGLFNESFGDSGASCLSRGFRHANGLDDCALGITTFFRNPSSVVAFATRRHKALAAFSARYALPLATASLMEACVCQPDSHALGAVAGRCGAVDAEYRGSWIHEDPWNGTQLICNEGPFVFATRALAVLKSSPELAMHFYDQISPAPCNTLGFPEMFPPEDHCFPENHIWTRTNIFSDPGTFRSIAAESNISSGGFVTLMEQHHALDDIPILNNNLGCNCLPSSAVGQQVAEYCNRLPISPVRDWWAGAD